MLIYLAALFFLAILAVGGFSYWTRLGQTPAPPASATTGQ
jgi:TRAP-type C4-dicarboxylate transport system permease small subunit